MARRSFRREPGPGQNGGFLGRAYEPLLVGDVRSASGAMPGLEVAADLPITRLQERLKLKQSLDQLADESGRQHAGARPESTVWPGVQHPGFSPSARVVRSGKGTRRRSAIGTAATVRGKRCCWRGDWWKPACRTSTSFGIIPTAARTTLPTTPISTGGTRITTSSRLSSSDCCRGSTKVSRPCWKIWTSAGSSIRRSSSAWASSVARPKSPSNQNSPVQSPGRKHWANVYSIVMAGAGVKRGAIVGASDRLGGEPISERYGPWDVAATIFNALGIPPTGHYADTFGRPFAIAQGQVMEAAYHD